MKIARLSEKLSNLVEVVRDFTEVKVIATDERSVTIYLKEFDLEYRLFDYDWYFVEALRIMFFISISDKYADFSDKFHLFSGYDLDKLTYAIREDYNHLGGIYESYFFEVIIDGHPLKESITKEDVYKYIEFINKATSF